MLKKHTLTRIEKMDGADYIQHQPLISENENFISPFNFTPFTMRLVKGFSFDLS